MWPTLRSLAPPALSTSCLATQTHDRVRLLSDFRAPSAQTHHRVRLLSDFRSPPAQTHHRVRLPSDSREVTAGSTTGRP